MKWLANLIVLFTLYVVFHSCTKDTLCNDISCISEQSFLGKWTQESDGKYVHNNNETICANIIFEFFSGNDYTVIDNGSPIGVSLFSKPSIPGTWSYDKSDEEIFFYQAKKSGQTIDTLNTDQYTWKILEFHVDSFEVAIFDKNGDTISELTKLKRI